MRRIFIKTICTVALSMLTSVAWADNCNTERNTFDMFYCKDKVYQQADKDLNTAYQDLSARLSGKDKATLKSVQLAWMRSRDSECIKEENGELVLYVNCRLNKTTDQTNFLNERIRECKSTGCQPRRLKGE